MLGTPWLLLSRLLWEEWRSRYPPLCMTCQLPTSDVGQVPTLSMLLLLLATPCLPVFTLGPLCIWRLLPLRADHHPAQTPGTCSNPPVVMPPVGVQGQQWCWPSLWPLSLCVRRGVPRQVRQALTLPFKGHFCLSQLLKFKRK